MTRQPEQHWGAGVPPASSPSPQPDFTGGAGVPPASSPSPQPNVTGGPGVPPASSPSPQPISIGGAGVPPASSPSTRSSFAFFDGKHRERAGGDLPHWEHAGAHYFITFRLNAGELTHPERQTVLDACQFWHGARYYLGAAVVMPDHVHLLFRILQQPDGSWPTLRGILHSIKSFTAHRILKSRGEPPPLWQPEYFDKIIRSEREYEEYINYILLNPRRAGLVRDDEPYPFIHRYQSARVQGGRESLEMAQRQRVVAGVQSADAGGTPAPPVLNAPPVLKDGSPPP